MARPFAYGFYRSQAWRKTQAAYMESVNHVCERCGRPARIVHHRQWLTPANINDPNVSLDWGNLEALCIDCHNAEHFGGSATAQGYEFDAYGDLVPCRGLTGGVL